MIACAFTQKVVKFIEMMQPKSEEEIQLKKGMTPEELVQHKNIHYLFHYGHERSEVQVDEHVSVTNDEILEKAYGGYNWKKEFFKHNTSDHAHVTFAKNAIDEIKKRMVTGDFILCFWGLGHQPIADAFKDTCIIVEPGIGYKPSSSINYSFKVFESYAIMHYSYGLLKKEHGVWYDCVIPNYFNKDDFEFRDKKEDYYLYLGRLISSKGVDVVIDLAKRQGFKLLIAGQGSLDELGHEPDTIPDNIQYVGYADLEKRRELMAGARALFLPTYYIEPFGGVTMEAMMSGTPVITTDWGVFAETVLHGVTGYRCRTMDHFEWALNNIDTINPHNCREWAMNNYSIDAIRKMYEEYFDMLIKVKFGEGFYEKNPSRTELDWLCKTYPVLE
jgi:glycosyltransferase involved in cell wall biosynthesis